MKPLWDNLSVSFKEVHALMEEFGQGITDVRTMKAFKKILAAWNKLVVLHNEFDRQVEPIPREDIRYPFEGETFRNMWQTYKDYLLEDHNMTIGSRRENIMLSRLKKMSETNQARAIEMLEFFIASGYKNIFKPSDRQLTGDEPAKTEEQSTINPNATPKARL